MNDRLFEGGEAEVGAGSSEGTPLAVRMRPRTLEDLVGQEHLLAEGSTLRKAIETGEPHSMVLYGPPGTGKTTIARIVATAANGAFEEQSAVNAGRAEVRAMLERAEERRRGGRRTVFFLDEIHRFNKAQQDALLPAVEEGLVTLIGATTENPFFEVNSALLSRSQIYELRPLGEEQVVELLRRALDDPERGLAPPPRVDDEALAMLADRAGGDARQALGALERAATTVGPKGHIDLAVAEDALQRKAVLYDKSGDKHYDYISAWIKSTRASDVDASIYYLAAMLEGGEDPRYIARRMVIFASEDIGNADPQALVVATSVGAAVDRVGLPECRLNLAQGAVYLALAPKSNASYAALLRAEEHVRENGAGEPPSSMRSAAYPGAKKLGRGVGYRYPHDEPGALNDQRALPDSVAPQKFFEPSDRGFEIELGERLERIRNVREGGSDGGDE